MTQAVLSPLGQQSAEKHKEAAGFTPNLSLLLLLSFSVGGKLYENSHSHTATETTSLGGPAGYKRPQPSSSLPGIGGAAAGGGGDDGVKKKKKGNWRNRFGPCFTTDVKASEPAPSLTLPSSSTANTTVPTSSSSTASTSSSSSSTLTGRPGMVSSSGLGLGAGGERGLGVMGVTGGIQNLRNGSLQSSSATAAGPGEETSGAHETQQ